MKLAGPVGAPWREAGQQEESRVAESRQHPGNHAKHNNIDMYNTLKSIID